MVEKTRKSKINIWMLIGAVVICTAMMQGASLADNPLGVSDTEYNALIALYNSTNGGGWFDSEGWLTNSPDWHGVTVTDNHVISLDLAHNNLNGQIPAELGSLTSLTYLALDTNQISGQIPAGLGNLSNLCGLILSSNQLTGQIPTTLGNLTNLRTLNLFYNQLSGQIPVELGSLTNLESLSLSGNQLSGTIPAQLGALSNLGFLALDMNLLTGSIPPELGSLRNLWWLNLDGNQLTGQIPSELGNLTNLQHLYLANNQLTGQIPPSLGNMSSLCRLLLGFNQLSGQIPAELGNLTNLEDLNVHGNQLSGLIPAALGNLTNLEHLYLDSNQLSGQIPAELGDLTSLIDMNLSTNRLDGPLPSELGGLTHLHSLNLSGNRLICNVPSSITNLNQLTSLDLSYNGFVTFDQAVLSFLASHDPDWQDTQTAPPVDISLTIPESGSVAVSWTPIPFNWGGGYYEIGYSFTDGGPYTYDPANRTLSKSESSLVVSRLDHTDLVHFVVRTVSPAGWWNQSDLTSMLSQEAVTPPGGKMGGNGRPVGQDGMVVTAVFDDCFYIEKQDRTWGIRVIGYDQPIEPGQVVNIAGTRATNEDGERCIQDPHVALVGSPGDNLRPLYMPNRALGGGSWLYDAVTGAGQCGVAGGCGLNNIGLLVKITGKITNGGYGFYYIDDGSKCSDGSGNIGVRVDIGNEQATIPDGTEVWVTGISSCFRCQGNVARMLRATDGDIIPLP